MENTVTVEIITDSSSGVVDGLNHLLPQLNDTIEPVTSESLQSILAHGNTILFVARMNHNDIVGTLTLIMHITASGTRGYIEDVVVDSEFRKHGIGKQLMDAAISKSKELKAEYIDLTSRPSRQAANSLYQKIGFVKRDTNIYRLAL